MNVLEMVLSVLEAILNSSLLSAAPEKLSTLLALVITLGKEGESAYSKLSELATEIREIDAAGGDVPDEVWDKWEERHSSAHARLQALKTAPEEDDRL